MPHLLWVRLGRVLGRFESLSVGRGSSPSRASRERTPPWTMHAISGETFGPCAVFWEVAPRIPQVSRGRRWSGGPDYRTRGGVWEEGGGACKGARLGSESWDGLPGACVVDPSSIVARLGTSYGGVVHASRCPHTLPTPTTKHSSQQQVASHRNTTDHIPTMSSLPLPSRTAHLPPRTAASGSQARLVQSSWKAPESRREQAGYGKDGCDACVDPSEFLGDACCDDEEEGQGRWIGRTDYVLVTCRFKVVIHTRYV